MYSKNFVLSGILLMSLVLAGCTGAAYAQSSTPTAQAVQVEPVNRTINVSGSGRAFLTPDIAYVNIGVHTEGENAAEAVAENTGQSEKVIEALKKMGIAEKDIQTNNFNIYPRQEYDPQGKPSGKITYSVDNTVHVTVRDLDTIGEALDAVVKAGANSIGGIQFDVFDKTTGLSEARQAAVEAAHAKAEELSEAAGVTLGEVRTISEYSGGYPVPVPLYESRAAPAVLADAAVPISPGEMTVTVEVNMVYEIR